MYGGTWEGDKVLEGASTFGARAQFHVNRVLGVEATYGLVPTTRTDLDTGSSDAETLSQFGFNAVLNLAAAALTPYVTAGVGFVAAEDTDFATNLGLGAKYYFSERIAVRADVRGWFSADAPAKDEYAHFELTGGLSLQLGGDDDLDNDGIRNRDDKCPTKAEDRDGFQDDDGCAEADNDADGIEDKDDKCPDQPEDKDGDKDEDGCPDLDDDGDGIPNDVDKCGDKAEDMDGFEDDDGCPELDNDKDGIEDAQDKCPSEAETKNGYKDEDGCPDGDADGDGFFDDFDGCKDEAETFNGFKDADGCKDALPEDLAAVLGVQDGLRFESAKPGLTKASFKKLDAVAEVLARYPEVKFVIGASAHKAKDVDVLSSQRAGKIRAYFVEKGAQGASLTAKGLGAAELPAGAPEKAPKDFVSIEISVDKKAAIEAAQAKAAAAPTESK